MSKDTVKDEMFNFGGTIEEIKSKSLEETHLSHLFHLHFQINNF
jgi:hypothetical protein